MPSGSTYSIVAFAELGAFGGHGFRIPQLPGYVGEFELIDDHRSGKIVLELNGRINKCGVIRHVPAPVSPAHAISRVEQTTLHQINFGWITAPAARCDALSCSPRFDVSADGYEKWIGNLLPSRQFGHIVVTTSYGIMDHEEARRKGTGGKLLGFFY